MRLITEPTVYLMGRQHVVGEEVFGFLKDNGFIGWESDSENDSEILCETAGRVCYLSFTKPRPGGNAAYLHNILESGHGSVLEHAVWNLLVTGVSRSLTHELVRHRAGMSPSQLSQRYVDESTAEYVVPPDLQEEVAAAARWLLMNNTPTAAVALQYVYDLDNRLDVPVDIVAGLEWIESAEIDTRKYKFLSDYLFAKKQSPELSVSLKIQTECRKFARQAARSVLPNATETKIFLTINARAARNVIEQRGSRHAEPEIRMLAYKVWEVLYGEAPNLFGDYEWKKLEVVGGNVIPQDVTTPYRKV